MIRACQLQNKTASYVQALSGAFSRGRCASVTDEGVGLEHAHAMVPFALNSVGGGPRQLLHTHCRAERATEDVRHELLCRVARAGEAAHDKPHRLEEDAERQRHAAPILCACHDAGLQDQHAAAVGTEPRRLGVFLGDLLGHFLALAVAGDEAPGRHGRVYEDDARDLLFRRGTQHRDIGFPVRSHGLLSGAACLLRPRCFTDSNHNRARPLQHGPVRLRLQGVDAASVLNSGAEVASSA
eukprot:CAMPEP_0117493386 /NCGR_PEP_ID=MMETSP0784-20121206/19071_1 /TAXON_ID=39447 /ORGANISM="" /LENGTH=239 /DNA_ID=CAMNT_0005288237 /DNA_START=152 /DNA_END=871 /DNA_ORIENTATION=-